MSQYCRKGYRPAFLLLVMLSIHADGVANTSVSAVPSAVRAMDYTVLPSDANLHHRTKWSNGVHVLIDDDEGGPLIYVFNRSGKVIFDFLIQVPGANQIRVHDFAAALDGSVWTVGQASSRSGRMTYFLTHIQQDGQSVQLIQTTPYRATQLSVAPDGTVWTAGINLSVDSSGKSVPPDLGQNVLRRFEASGKLIGSGIPLGSIDKLRCYAGYLVATQDRIGWYSPVGGTGSYVEFSLDLRILNTYPTPVSGASQSQTLGFTLTPDGKAFVVARTAGNATALYLLDRTNRAWIPVEGLPLGSADAFPMLDGSDGESLIFKGPPDKSKLRVVTVAASPTH